MTTDPPLRVQVEAYMRKLQNDIVEAFERLDPNSPPFKREVWERPEGGAGISAVFSTPIDSNSESVLEKAGINISIIHGHLPPAAIKQMASNHSNMPLPESHPEGLPFFVSGLSLVIHPRNPHAPTVHANYRYFEISDTKPSESGPAPKVLSWWFGGGGDLTPSYLYPSDATHFHTTFKTILDQYSPSLHAPLKKWCDEYFYIPHRKECRGVGGIFFDDLNDGDHARLTEDGQRPRTAEGLFAMIKSLGNGFIPSYLPILEKRSKQEYSSQERRWQLIRRGRYVEFNLMYDRGTKFGLATPGARIESILMTMPETVRWEYQTEMGTNEDSEEAKLLKVLTTPVEWV